MKHNFSIKHLSNWREPLLSLASETPRDLIYEETLAIVERGRLRVDERNAPELLFIKAFNLPETPYLRQAGWHLIRDIVAMRVRPAFRAPPVIPQLLYVLCGPENDGKSTFVKILAGGCVTPSSTSERYSDSINFKDLEGSASHGDHTLHNKIAGKTTVEFADKSLGSTVGKGLADILKHFTNKGGVEYREMNKDDMKRCNLRCVRVFTTNNKEILTEDMGERRWVIINTEDGNRLKAADIQLALLREQRLPTKDEQMLLKGHNPGLNWLCENLEPMLAQMYDSGAWKAELNPTTQMLQMMKKEQREYQSVENWQIVLDHELSLREGVENLGITPVDITNWALDLPGSKAPTSQQYGAFMHKKGWDSKNHRLMSGKQRRVWFRETEGVKNVKVYLVWAPGSGRWQTQSEPNADDRKLLLDNATPTANGKDVPF
jgi:hypothetical protein